MSDLEILRRELLERGDEMISFQQLVERFDSVEKEFGNTPWNLKQIYSNFNILTGENPNKWIPVSERLPDIHNYCMKYLVTDCYGHIHTSLFTESGGKGWWSHSDVVAWMPLPKSYVPTQNCNCGCKMVDIEKDNTHYDEFGFIDPFSFRKEVEE